jgi:hypothetical protein
VCSNEASNPLLQFSSEFVLCWPRVLAELNILKAGKKKMEKLDGTMDE